LGDPAEVAPEVLLLVALTAASIGRCQCQQSVHVFTCSCKQATRPPLTRWRAANQH
jgi:hypothetical protein